jgi:hypothetical protein
MINFLMINLVYTFIDTVVVHFVYKHQEFSTDAITNIVRAIFWGIIWTSYLRSSEQVKETFIMPHDSEIS